MKLAPKFLLFGLFCVILINFLLFTKFITKDPKIPAKVTLEKKLSLFDLKFPDNPLISIIIPTFNSLDYLPHAVESVLKQTYKNFELIIVNDASTDKSKEYLDTIKDKRVKIIHHEVNKKLPSALNTGFHASKGDFLTWISSDNICTDIFLEEMLKTAKDFKESKFLYSDYYIINDKERVLIEYHAGAAVTNGVFHGGGARYTFKRTARENGGVAAFLYPRDVLAKIGDYDPDLLGTEDWDYWLRILEWYPLGGYLPKPLMYYRIHDKSMTKTMKDTVFQRESKMLEKRLKRHGSNLFSIHLAFPALRFCVEKQKSKIIAMMIYAEDLTLGKYSQQLSYDYQHRIIEENEKKFYNFENNVNLAITLGVNNKFKESRDMIQKIRNDFPQEQSGHDQYLTFIGHFEEISKYKNKRIPKFLKPHPKEEIFIKQEWLENGYSLEKSPIKHPRGLGIILSDSKMKEISEAKLNQEKVRKIFDPYQVFDHLILFFQEGKPLLDFENSYTFSDQFQLSQMINQEKIEILLIFDGSNDDCKFIKDMKNVVIKMENSKLSVACKQVGKYYLINHDQYLNSLVNDYQISKEFIISYPNSDLFSIYQYLPKNLPENFDLLIILTENKELIEKTIVENSNMKIILIRVKNSSSKETFDFFNKKFKGKITFLEIEEIQLLKGIQSTYTLFEIKEHSLENIDVLKTIMNNKSIIISKDEFPINFYIQDHITGILLKSFSDNINFIEIEQSKKKILYNLQTNANIFYDPYLELTYIYRMIHSLG